MSKRKRKRFFDDIKNHKQISKELESKFEEYEKQSTTLYECPLEKCLVVRLDGFKLTKKYLRDVLVNEEFEKRFSFAINTLINSFIQYFKNESFSAFICGYKANDEFSVILNKTFKGHTEGRKIIKICTLFSGVFSAAFTLANSNEKDESPLTIFDARPIIIDENEIVDYIYSRYLISERYAFGKVWKLNTDKYIDTEILYDLEISEKRIMELHKLSDVRKLLQAYQMYFYNDFDGKPTFMRKKIRKYGLNKQWLENKITCILKGL